MPSTVEFPFSDDEALPTIPVILSYADSSVSTNALLDTGSTVNLLPYDIGLQARFGIIKLSACHWLEIWQRLKHGGYLCKFKLGILNPFV